MDAAGRSFARVCDCRRSRRAQDLLRAARIPKRYCGCDFTSFSAQDASQESARAQARAFVDSYSVLKVQEEAEFGLLFLGPPGVGKTHLAVGALRSLIVDQGVPGIFADFRDLIKEIQASYDPVSQISEMTVLRPLLWTEVLVLDDLGATRMTEWVRDMVGHIVNSRYNERRVTIITTNLDDEPAGAQRRAGREEGAAVERARAVEERGRLAERPSLTDRIGAAVRSRLHEMCLPIRIEGEDFRLRLKPFGRREVSRR